MVYYISRRIVLQTYHTLPSKYHNYIKHKIDETTYFRVTVDCRSWETLIYREKSKREKHEKEKRMKEKAFCKLLPLCLHEAKCKE